MGREQRSGEKQCHGGGFRGPRKEAKRREWRGGTEDREAVKQRIAEKGKGYRDKINESRKRRETEEKDEESG